MKNKSWFSQIMLIVVISLICISLTVTVAIFAGTYNSTLFDITNLNFANVFPVLIVGGFLSCIVIGITVLFVSKSLFEKVKNNILEINKEEEKK